MLTLFVVLIVLYIFITGIILVRMAMHYKCKFIRYSSEKLDVANISSGDIILFNHVHHVFINSIIYSGHFSHSGIVFMVDDEKYISESTKAGELLYDGNVAVNGVNISPLEKRLRQYNGDVYVARYNGKLDKESTDKLYAAAVKKMPYPSLFQAGLSIIIGYKYGMHCFQHVADCVDTFAGTDLKSDCSYLRICRRISYDLWPIYAKPVRLLELPVDKVFQ